MISLFVLAASAAMSVPTPVKPASDPGDWFRTGDLPEIDGKAAMTTFDLIIDSSGRPTDCKIVVRSGSEKLDAAVCIALMKRARFKPAKDVGGSDVASVYRDRIVWLPTATGPNYWFANADIVVSTSTITQQVKKFSEVIISNDFANQESSCAVNKSIGSAELDRLACSIAKNSDISPPITIDREYVRSVRLLRVAFEPASTQKVTIR